MTAVVGAVAAVVTLVGLGWSVGRRLGATEPTPEGAVAEAGPATSAAPGATAASTTRSAPRGLTGVYRPTTTTRAPRVIAAVVDPLGGALMVPATLPPTSQPPTAVPPTATTVTAAGEAAPPPATAAPTTVARTTTTTVPPIRLVTGVGDSIMLGASERLTEAVRVAVGAPIAINARVGRPFAEGVEVVHELADAGEVGDAAIVHLGTNGPIDEAMVHELLDRFRALRVVVVVNVRVPLEWEASVNEVLATVAPTYPNVRFVDWYAATVDRPELFWADGVHLRPEGSAYYADLLAAALQG